MLSRIEQGSDGGSARTVAVNPKRFGRHAVLGSIVGHGRAHRAILPQIDGGVLVYTARCQALCDMIPTRRASWEKTTALKVGFVRRPTDLASYQYRRRGVRLSWALPLAAASALPRRPASVRHRCAASG